MPDDNLTGYKVSRDSGNSKDPKEAILKLMG